MEPQSGGADMAVIAQVLGELRDSWLLVSMALKDHLADAPSPDRDAMLLQVERHLARIKEGERGAFE